jgi:glycosyltransferase involved in cell wall biosynthesis
MKEKIDSLDTSFNFLMFGQITSSNVLTDRKNTFNCLKWLCDELKDDKDAGIIIKTNMGRMTKQDRSYTNLMVKKVLSRVRKGKYPKVYVFHGLMDKDELGAIYDNENVKALCAPTRGEGWGLPILDAAASGLPVIATNSTGHMDFMKSVKFLEVESTPVEVPAQMVDGRIWVTGAKWAHPLENSFKERVRKFRKSSSKPKEWAESSAKKINSKFSAESVMSIYDEVLKEYVNES